jgi:hypothetical protein
MIIPLQLVRILGQTTLVDIAPTSQYGSQTDCAVIRTQVLIENPGDEMRLPVSYLTTDPNETTPPVLRIGTEKREMGSKDDFVDPVAKEALIAQAVAAASSAGIAPEIVRSSMEQVVAAAQQHHKSYITVKAGQKLLLEFVNRERLRPDANKTVTFTTLAPLPQYSLAAGGVLWISVALPRAMAGINSVTLISATENYEKRADALHDRTFVTWRWQNDPLLSLAYQYA